jgi:hypothetical protein
MWIPNLRSSRAAALAVPLNQPYQMAIRDKLVRLLKKANKRESMAAVQTYLAKEEHEYSSLQFPEGWADHMLWSDSVNQARRGGGQHRAHAQCSTQFAP